MICAPERDLQRRSNYSIVWTMANIAASEKLIFFSCGFGLRGFRRQQKTIMAACTKGLDKCIISLRLLRSLYLQNESKETN